MPDKVIDASIIAAWCFREPRAEEAFEIIRTANIFAPHLLWYELASIARRKIITYPNLDTEIRYALQIALALPVHWVNVDHFDVLQTSFAAGITTYDASYLHLSRTLNAPLITFDNQLAEAAQKFKIM